MRPPVPSGTVFIKDPVDVWGEEKTIGLSELGVRVHAAAMPFDRRGDVIYWDDFESPSAKCDMVYDADGSVNRSTTNPLFGDFCMKFVTGTASGNWTQIRYPINDFHVGTIGAQISFASTSSDSYLYAMIDYYTGTTELAAALKYDLSTNILTYYGDDGNYYTIDTIEVERSIGSRVAYNTIKLAVDLQTGKYIRSLFFGEESDLSAHSIHSNPNITPRSLLIRWYFATSTTAAQTAYWDNFIVTENEPT